MFTTQDTIPDIANARENN